MSKFKVGEKVRRTGHTDEHFGVISGGTYTVAATDIYGWLALVEVPGRGRWWSDKYFELVHPVVPAASPHNVAGVQPHSPGGLYPFVIVYRDKRVAFVPQGLTPTFDDKYDTGIQGPGLPTTLWFKSRDAAHHVAEQLLEHRA